MNKPIKLDYKKAYNELKKVNSNLGLTIKQLESEIKFNKKQNKELQDKFYELQELNIKNGAKSILLSKERDFYKKIIDKLIQ